MGLDTSCYTTSMAVINKQGKIIAKTERPLEVAMGKGGLRQSEAVFQHINNLPQGLTEIKKQLNVNNLDLNLAAIAVSSRPRPIEGSYMPVFKVGDSYAKALSLSSGIPLLEYTHQEGHIASIVYEKSNNIRLEDMDKFLVFHVSGGTTELLICHTKGKFSSFDIEIIGGTKDIAAGQLIDRTAKLMNLPFPGGPHLEKLGDQSGQTDISVPFSVEDTKINFSGPETHIKRLIHNEDYPKPAVARGIEQCVAKSLLTVLENALKKHQVKNILFVGGVMSNSYIKNYLSKNISNEKYNLIFGSPELSKDNAVGVAWLGYNNFFN
ncbi:O-sialoglycoprotein endopeptidase [Natranaerobius thermophilus JW/NM-WN-LF]|uniref:N(6)-L-threonylcarbamoyladenine synthase n=2 Tax=Natranaerobius TaxID=375928 RepID=B2A533_NATTJ|nr:O-sialoglycoprotein endopeptidase [Natranaerobius thermophilus JW/NM-WN-LF]